MELIDKVHGLSHDNYTYLHVKGWGLYRQGNYREALELLNKSWKQKPAYDHELFLHIEEAKELLPPQFNFFYWSEKGSTISCFISLCNVV